jgi:TetR/AcrR family transcriptional regulator
MARPRAEDYNEKRQYILDKAATLFAEQGFSATSISAIANYCGTSKALLYHYYESKEALLFDMLNSHCALLVEAAMAAANEKGPADQRLRVLVTSLMEIYVGARHKHVVLLNDLHCLPLKQQKQVRKLEKEVVRVLKDLVAQLRPKLSVESRTALAMYLLGAINWTYTWFNPKGPISPEEFADIATSLFLEGVSRFNDEI